MNKARRTQIDALIAELEFRSREIEFELEADEQEAFDNMPESFQEGERGEAAQASIDALAEARTSLDDAIEYLKEAQGE